MADPISAAVARGRETGGYDDHPPSQIIREAREAVEDARASPDTRAARLARVLGLVEHFPASESLQIQAARILEASAHPATEAGWAGIVERFPTSTETFRQGVRHSARVRGRDSVLRFVRGLDRDGADLISTRLRQAVALEELGESAAADAVFATLLREFSKVEAVHFEHCRLLIARRAIRELMHALQTATMQFPHSPWFADKLEELRITVAEIELVAPGILAYDGVLSTRMLECLLDKLASERPPATPLPYVGAVMMVTASLGLGGAERQLVNSALALQRAIQTGRSIAGYNVLGPLTICARDLTPRKGNDFFLRELRDNGVPVIEYMQLAGAGGDFRHSVAAGYGHLLRYLPERMVEGVAKLAGWLVWEGPDVVQIWQDSMVYAAALAALIAKVPRIVLSTRTLPPIDRPERLKPEYEMLYRALARVPGVVLTTNSRAAAERYEQWLGLAPGRMQIIHNGNSRLNAEASEASSALAAAFDDATRDATFTLGCAMRIDANKRPFEWVEVAAELHHRLPRARFIVVGDGPLLAGMREFVHRRGLAQRFLFTGRSSDVGFWLGRMSTLLMLSRHEGLPNIAIEAQLAGVPIVATPAGGLAETIRPGGTGELLSSAETIDRREVVDKLLLIAGDGARLRRMSHAAKVWAAERFSIERMIVKTVEVFADPVRAGHA